MVINRKVRVSKRFVIACAAIWIATLNLYLFFYHYDSIRTTIGKVTSTNNNAYGSGEIDEYNEDNNWSFDNEKNQHEIHKSAFKPLNTSILEDSSLAILQKYGDIIDRRNIDPIFSSNYERIFNQHPNPVEVFANLNFKERCNLYFENLHLEDHNWFLNPNDHAPLMRYLFPYKQGIEEFDYEVWKDRKYGDLESDFIKETKLEIDKDNADEDKRKKIDVNKIEKFIRKKYEAFQNETLRAEQRVLDAFSHLRIFNKCYLSDNDANLEKKNVEFVDNQKQFYRRLLNSVKVPAFVPSKEEKTLQVVSSNCQSVEQRLYPWLSKIYPVYERWNGDVVLSPPKYVTSSPSSKSHFTENTCFFKKFKSELNGKGLVFTMADMHLEAAINLIKLLRGLGNTLPIQIVYYDNLSGKSKKQLVKAAREEFKDLPASFEKVTHLLPKGYEKGLPPQEIWFVNTYNVISEQYKNKFEGYGNKLLATIFNSFEEFILLDADTVIFKNPEWFFSIPKYKKTGAMFYKDRSTTDIRPKTDILFYKKMFPSTLDSLMFDIPQITDKTLNLDAMQGMYHFMEAGVVILNKARNFNSILLLPQLSFMEPFRERSHGEKEFFWLAFAVDGNESYEFNDYRAAAVGEVNEHRHKDNGDLYLSKQLCNAHPAHLHDVDNSLLWLNSGFHFCGKFEKVDFKNDLEHQKNYYVKTFQTVEEIKKYYYDPIPIRQAILPPFKNAYENVAPNSEGEPPLAWEMLHVLCYDYMWCTYSSIGAGDNFQNGTVIDFSEEEVNHFKFLGDIWVGNE
ncbi:mannosyltransferase [Scheffersomyces amazonensis]|uniref:mannosyltransferase n=1 Tax=Scheffersomyces amazonensis TaxID=1078765 RepID=UPI00315D9240